MRASRVPRIAAIFLMMVLALLAGGAGQIKAEVIFSNFGPGDSYDLNHGATIGLAGGTYIDTAVTFTPIGNSFTLDRIELAVGLANPAGQGFGPNLLDVALTTSVGGFPGSVLEMFHFVDAMGPFTSWNAPLIADSALHPLLSEGTQYWLVASAPDPGTTAAWNWNTTGDLGAHAQRVNGGSWFFVTPSRGAFRVSGTAVPEPSTFPLLSLGAVALLGYALRQKRIKLR
jgi:hypothetical protein